MEAFFPSSMVAASQELHVLSLASTYSACLLPCFPASIGAKIPCFQITVETALLSNFMSGIARKTVVLESRVAHSVIKKRY